MKPIQTQPRVAIYCRVSTQDQSCEPQLLELRAVAKQRGLIVSHEICDVISGSKSSREGLDRLMAMIRAGKVDTVLVVKIDRLARSLGHFAQLIGEFNARRVALIVPGQNIDTSESNPASRFMITVLAAVAELERDLIRERTKAGLAVARASGKRLGRPSPRMEGVDRRAVVAAWRTATGGVDYASLGKMLGGVSPATAWRVEKRIAEGKEQENPQRSTRANPQAVTEMLEVDA